MDALQLIFFGTAELACASLRALANERFCRICAVVTQPDRPKGRDLKLQPSPVKAEAQRLSLRILQPERARDARFNSELATFAPAIIVVVAYGQILPQSVLDLPRFGCLNVHTSLLPKYRGAAPIQWAILEDQIETGVTLMKMDAGLDTGDILAQDRTPILPTDNAQTLHDRLARLGAHLLARTIPDYVEGKIQPRPQAAQGASYARKITKDDGRLDWNLPARVLWNRIRAFTPWPGAFTYLPQETKQPLLKIWEANVEQNLIGAAGEVLHADPGGLIVACGQGALRIAELQREGSRRMTTAQFLAGKRLPVGSRLASTFPPVRE